MLALATVPRDFALVCAGVLARALGVVVVAWRLAVLNSTFSLLARFFDLPESAELFLFQVQEVLTMLTIHSSTLHALVCFEKTNC